MGEAGGGSGRLLEWERQVVQVVEVARVGEAGGASGRLLEWERQMVQVVGC